MSSKRRQWEETTWRNVYSPFLDVREEEPTLEMKERGGGGVTQETREAGDKFA